jgi:hypothetical protein
LTLSTERGAGGRAIWIGRHPGYYDVVSKEKHV